MLNSVISRVFLSLVKAGLWEQGVRLSQYNRFDLEEIYRLAEEQAVVGLVAAGIEHVDDVKLCKEDVLTFIGTALQIEQRNVLMNDFIEDLMQKMRIEGIYVLLVKGQGIAQCYERPLWRAAGDVDLLFSDVNYKSALDFLTPLASYVSDENPYNKHIAITIDPWTIELHGTLRGLLRKRMDRVVDDVQRDVFYSRNVRSWLNGKTQVFLPGADNDVVFIFSHILQHFFKEEITLRQICD